MPVNATATILREDRESLPQTSGATRARSLLTVCDLIPLKYGGYERFLIELGRGCAAGGIRMGLLLAGEPIPPVADAFRSQGISWWTIPDWKDQADQEHLWRFIRGFARINALEPWDVVAFHFCKPLSVMAACTWSRIRDGRRFACVWHQHQGIASPKGVRKHISTLRMLGPFMNAYVALSELGAKSYSERRCAPDKVKVIYNGCQTPDRVPRGRLRSKLGLSDSDKLVGTVASLIWRKGLDILLKAVAPLFQGHPERRLAIVGTGELLDELQNLSQQLGVKSQVHFLGAVENVTEVLADCNIFVLPSRNEALPMAILEAMAVGLPVVAADVGGVREVVIHGRTGLVVPPEDSDALRAALANLLEDDALARDCGVQGRARQEEVFSLERTIDEHVRLYRAVGQ